MSALYSTSATLRAYQRATVTARTRGRIERLFVEEGDAVRQGQSLARLENDEQEIAFERARTSLDTLQAEFERTESLFEQELVSQDAFEKKRREVRDASQAAALARLELDRTVVGAPFAGVVLERHLDVGNTVADGTAVYTLADTDVLRADVNVPERHVARLAAGQIVRLTADATDTTVEAEIERLAPAVDPETGTVKVTLRVEGSAGLRPGSFVRVDIETENKADALVVPRSALVAEGRRWSVYRVIRAEDRPAEAAPAAGPAEASGQRRGRRGGPGAAGPGAGGPPASGPPPSGLVAEQVVVRLGFESGDRVEILPADGAATIATGDRVVVAGAGGLSDGAAIVLEDAAEEAAADGEQAEEAAEGAGGDVGS